MVFRSQSDLLFLISPKHCFLPSSVPSRTDMTERKCCLHGDVVEQFRLSKPRTSPTTHTCTHRHPATLPPEVLDLHPPGPSPEEGRSKQAHPRPIIFLNLASSRMSCPLAVFPIRMDRRDLKGEKKPEAPQKKTKNQTGVHDVLSRIHACGVIGHSHCEVPADSFSV